MRILGVTYRYQIFVPVGYTPTRDWPVVVYLSSSGGRGSDGIAQTNGVLGEYLRGPGSALPAVIVFPQFPLWPEGQIPYGSPILDSIPKVALDSTILQARLNPGNVYLTGWSMGAYLGWRIAYLWPNRFAAFMPLSGGVTSSWVMGNPSADVNQVRALVAERLKALPIWAFQGGADDPNILADDRGTVQAFEAAGSAIRYTEFLGQPHNIESLVYTDASVWQWLFAQHR